MSVRCPGRTAAFVASIMSENPVSMESNTHKCHFSTLPRLEAGRDKVPWGLGSCGGLCWTDEIQDLPEAMGHRYKREKLLGGTSLLVENDVGLIDSQIRKP